MKFDWRKSEVLTRLSGPRLFDRTFFWWTYWAGFALQITFDVIAYDSPSWLWLPVWTAGHLLAALVAIGIRWSFLDSYLEKKPNPFLNIAVASLLGAVRITFIGYASFVLELQGLFDLGARILAGVIAGSFGFIVIVNYTESSRSYREITKNLLDAQARLSIMRRSAKKTLKSNQEKVRKDLRQLVEPRLEELAEELRANDIKSSVRRSLIGGITTLLESQVRPLSNSFRSSAKTLSDPKLEKSVSRLSLFRLPSVVSPYLALSPVLVSLSIFAILPFSLYAFEDDSWIATGMLISIAVFVAVWLVRFLLSKSEPMSLFAGVSSLVILEVLLIIMIGDLLRLAGFPTESLPGVLVIVSIVLLASVSFTGIAAVQDFNRDEYVADLKRDNKRIERNLALLNQRLWVEKREWALRIHGTIQASLTAALVRLKQPGDLSTLDLALVRQHISQARKGLDQAQPTAFDFAKALRENKKAWQGILNIKSSLRSDAAKLLISDKWASVCANEIIKESLSNSTKHGKADQVEIRFELNQPGFVEIVTQDNGKGLSRSFRPGLGCELISEIAYPWSLTKGQEGGTILRARIPVSGKLIRSKN